MMKPAVHIMVGQEMHDNMEKALIDAVEHVKRMHYSRKICRQHEKNAV
jgi:hypothetical protein